MVAEAAAPAGAAAAAAEPEGPIRKGADLEGDRPGGGPTRRRTDPEGDRPGGGPTRRGPWRRRSSRVHQQFNEERTSILSAYRRVNIECGLANMITGPTELSMADGEWARE